MTPSVYWRTETVLKKLLNKLVDLLIAVAKRTPHFHLDGYMNRYFLIPETRFGAVRIHEILSSDDDRAYHDHPFWFVSIILKGKYMEFTPDYQDGIYCGDKIEVRRAGSIAFRRASDWHRLELFPGLGGKSTPVWTLFICGPRKRKWGFLTSPDYKTAHTEYTKDE